MASTIYTKRVILDKDFKEFPEGTNVSNDQTYVLKTYKYTQTYGIKGKEQEQRYVIVKGDKSLAFEQIHFEEFKKLNKLDAEEIINSAEKKSPTDKTIIISKSKFKALRDLAILFAGIMVLVVGSVFYIMVSEKNFKTEVKEFTQNSNVSLGDYVSANSVILDYITIEVTSTTTNYGVKTSERKSAGNTYVLMGHAEGGSETFLYRFDPNSADGGKFQKYMDGLSNISEDEIEFEDFFYSEPLKGEVVELSKVERLDSGMQIVPTLNTSAENFELSKPVYLIDGRVQNVSIVPVIGVTGALVGVTFLLIVAVIVFNSKFKSETKKQVTSLFDKENSPVLS